jgi:GNAT superfamily N-acetyltransferase
LTREERVTLEVYRHLAPVVVEAGGAIVMRYPQAPESPMLNRAIGLGVERPASEKDVDAVLEAMGRGTTYYVAVAPAARPPELPSWLATRGLEPGWGWMAFRRSREAPPPRVRTELQLEEVETAEQAASFAHIVCTGYGLPDTLEPVLARAPSVGFHCWLALEGDEPVSAAALYVSERAGYLGFAATLPEHRGKGAQNVLLAERIRRAAELGCDVMLTETGERREGLPSNSYRNIIRSGFEEVAVTANWLGRS